MTNELPRLQGSPPMKIYILSYFDDEEGCVTSYYTSKRNAQAGFARGRKDSRANGHKANNPVITAVNVKATKKDFVRFLNHWTPVHDNG